MHDLSLLQSVLNFSISEVGFSLAWLGSKKIEWNLRFFFFTVKCINMRTLNQYHQFWSACCCPVFVTEGFQVNVLSTQQLRISLVYSWENGSANRKVTGQVMIQIQTYLHTSLCSLSTTLSLCKLPWMNWEWKFCCCSVTKSCLTLCGPMGCSTPSFPVLHYLLEFAQIHVHWVSNHVESEVYLRPMELKSSC